MGEEKRDQYGRALYTAIQSAMVRKKGPWYTNDWDKEDMAVKEMYRDTAEAVQAQVAAVEDESPEAALAAAWVGAFRRVEGVVSAEACGRMIFIRFASAEAAAGGEGIVFRLALQVFPKFETGAGAGETGMYVSVRGSE